MDAKIRKYDPRDCDSVVELAEKYASWDTTPTVADIQGFWSRETDLFLVAEQEGRVVGFVFGLESNLPDEVLRNRKATKAGSVEVLVVDNDYRRKGMATALLNRLFMAFKGRGIDYVSLAVPAQEIAARKLYEKLGFEERGHFLAKRL